MVKKVIVILLIVAFLSSFVVAEEYSASKITVKSVPDVTVYLKIVEPSTSDPILYLMLLEKTDEYGDAYFMYVTNDTNKMEFDLEVKVKDGKVQVYPSSGTSLFGIYTAGEDVHIEAYEDYHNIVETPGRNVSSEDVNDTDEVTIIDNNETTDSEIIDDTISADLITGNSILDTLKKPAAYGGIGGVFILGILGLFIFGRRKKLKDKSATNSTGAKNNNHSEHSNEGHHELSRAEARLKSVQAEIQKLKDGSKVSEVRKRIAAEEEELRKLRSERV